MRTISPAWKRTVGKSIALKEVDEEQTLDSGSFASVYRHHLPGIYTYIRARIRDEEDASDLAHQVFLQALRALPAYQRRGIPVQAWLYRIARNAVIDFHRRGRTDMSWECLPEALQPSEESDTDGALIRQERLDYLRRALAVLSPEKRELLLLRFSSGLTVREIAVIVGRSEAAVKTEIRRTLRAIREQYDDD